MTKSQSFLQREIHPNYWKVGSVILSLLNALAFSMLLYVVLYVSPSDPSGVSLVALLGLSWLLGLPLALITLVFFRNYSKKQKMSAIEKLFFRIWLIGDLVVVLYHVILIISNL